MNNQSTGNSGMEADAGGPGNPELQLGMEADAGGPGNPELQLGINNHRGYYKRFLPHRDIGGMLQTITYRLADSLPAKVLDKVAAELKMFPPDQMEAERRKRLEDWLDAGYGCCALRHPEAAQCVIKAWQHFDGDRYDLLDWVVMPNHVHVLIRIYPGMMLGKIVQSWKSFTGRRIRKFMNGQIPADQKDGVWMREYWDRAIRDEKHFWITVKYIQNNPVKAGLVKSKEEWPWSSVSHHPEQALGGPRE